MCCPAFGTSYVKYTDHGVGLTWGIWPYPRSNSRRINSVFKSPNSPWAINMGFLSLEQLHTSKQAMWKAIKVKFPSVGPKFRVKFPCVSRGGGQHIDRCIRLTSRKLHPLRWNADFAAQDSLTSTTFCCAKVTAHESIGKEGRKSLETLPFALGMSTD